MGQCDLCGNDYDKSFEINLNGEIHVFDCFECAIQALAPECEGCGCKIIGHGDEADGQFFCSAHCAENMGVTGIKDRA